MRDCKRHAAAKVNEIGGCDLFCDGGLGGFSIGITCSYVPLGEELHLTSLTRLAPFPIISKHFGEMSGRGSAW